MNVNKSQHYNFTYEAMPIMFHSQTTEFLKYIERDGVKFLEFWWDHVGEKLPQEKHAAFRDVSCELTDLANKAKMVIVRLPPPAEDGESYYLGMIVKPERRFGWVKLPNTTMVCLIRRPSGRFPNNTELVALTPRARQVPIGPGPKPEWAEFKKAVLAQAK